jgi:hypothetical protein
MESSLLARDYECKLNSLKLLRQALDNQLISWAQYNTKQEEFLNVVNFHPPQEHLDTSRKVAIKVWDAFSFLIFLIFLLTKKKVQEMEKDLERVQGKGITTYILILYIYLTYFYNV